MRWLTISLALLLMACSDSTGPRAEVASVILWAQSTDVCVNCEVEVRVMALDGWGRQLPDREVLLTTSNDGVVSVRSITSMQKKIRGIAPGEATITATSEFKSSTLLISVFVPGPCTPSPWDFC